MRTTERKDEQQVEELENSNTTTWPAEERSFDAGKKKVSKVVSKNSLLFLSKVYNYTYTRTHLILLSLRRSYLYRHYTRGYSYLLYRRYYIVVILSSHRSRHCTVIFDILFVTIYIAGVHNYYTSYGIITLYGLYFPDYNIHNEHSPFSFYGHSVTILLCLYLK